MTVSRTISQQMQKSSWIRRMFEQGAELKAEHGEKNVFDFTLGNPALEPPTAFKEALVAAASDPTPGLHRYMPNVGFPAVRDAIAQSVGQEHDVPLEGRHVVMTTGAASALNVVLKALLDPGDEVITVAPYFVEYLFYVSNHGGENRVVETDENFQPDLGAIEAALNEKTRAVLVNTPNNPSGVVYEAARVAALGKIVEKHAEKIGRPVYLLMDDPYRRVKYVDEPHPSVIDTCRYGMIVTSYSKELGLAGERIGYIVANPSMPDVDELLVALSVSTRILGFVNAPAFMQRVLPLCGNASVDLTEYRRNRDILYEGLTSFGYEMPSPDGAFFMFPKVPGGDDIAFCATLKQHNVLVVPGRGFGTPGHIRISYAVKTDFIERALPHFEEALKQVS